MPNAALIRAGLTLNRGPAGVAIAGPPAPTGSAWTRPSLTPAAVVPSTSQFFM